MNPVFQLTKISRENYISIIDKHTLDQLNTVPIGFNNNIIWNVAHVVATYDILIYQLNQLPTRLSEAFVNEFRKGTVPVRAVDQAFVDDLKIKLIKQIEEVENDYKNGVIPQDVSKPYMTSFNFNLQHSDDILAFNNIHEALHMGLVMSLRKFV